MFGFLFLGLPMGGLPDLLSFGLFARSSEVGFVCSPFAFRLSLIPFQLLTNGRFFLGSFGFTLIRLTNYLDGALP